MVHCVYRLIKTTKRTRSLLFDTNALSERVRSNSVPDGSPTDPIVVLLSARSSFTPLYNAFRGLWERANEIIKLLR